MRSLAITVVSTLVVSSASADDRIWDQPVFGVFGFGTSWAGGIVPGINDTAVMGATIPTSINPITALALTNAHVRNWEIESGDYTLEHGNPGLSFRVADNILLGARRSSIDPGLAPISKLTLNFDGEVRSGWLHTGWNAHGHGVRDSELRIVGGTRLVVDNHAFIAEAEGSRTDVALIGPTASWAVGEWLYFGSGGTASLFVSDGSTLTTNEVSLGTIAGANGSAVVSGVATTWNSSGKVRVGDWGAGTLTIRDGAYATFSGLGIAELGESASNMGSVIVSGNNTRLDIGGGSHGGPLEVGRSGVGTLDITNGAAVTAGFASAGTFSSGDGVIRVMGAGSSLTSASPLDIGRDGRGLLRIADGGTAAAQFVSAGTFASTEFNYRGNGTIIVDGVGSSLSVASALDIGRDGDGVLEITNGAAVTAGFASVGTFASGNGTVLVAGHASTLEVAGLVEIGRDHLGRLSVTEGGLFTTPDSASIGTRGVGTAVITGAGTQMRIGNTLGLGWLGGRGALAVHDHGMVSVASRLTLSADSTIDVTGPIGGTVLVGTGGFGGAHLGSVVIGENGTLAGSGTIVGDVLVLGGVVSPGSSPGLLSIQGDFLLDSASLLTIELAGSTPGIDYDAVAVTGIAGLGGFLQIDTLGSFTPYVGQRFDIVTAGSLVGSFQHIDDRTGFGLQLDLSGGSLTLVATVPSPGTLLMLGIGGGAAARRRRR